MANRIVSEVKKLVGKEEVAPLWWVNPNEFMYNGLSEGNKKKDKLDAVKIRTNMSETAFFFPDLKTDENGDIILSFTAPEALTRWNVKAFAHTPDMQTGSLEKTLVTQKAIDAYT